MSGISPEFALSLRAWPKESNGSALPTLIQRINTERGDFRNLTEEDLLAEIAREEALGAAEAQEDDLSSEEEDEAEPDRAKEVMEQKVQMMQWLDQALYAANNSREFLSLLMTKTNPTQAVTTMSPWLREAVPIGTLGVDKISPRDTRLTIARRDDNKVVGKGWKIQALDRSVDSILAAATRLEKEIDCETKYWEEILAVDEKGWKTCKLPQERHTLGVRFGFFEAAPSFKNRSLAALKRADDGSVYLDQGVSDSTPKRVLVRIETKGVITGILQPERAVPDDAPLESLILRARNTILEEELWQELNREARDLANHDVRWDGTGLSIRLSPTTKALLSMEILTSSLPEYDGTHEDDYIAEGISLSLHLLLLYNHRQNLHRRSQPPPPISHQPRPQIPAHILKPLLKRIQHESTISSLTRTITSLQSTLKTAGLPVAPHTLTLAPRPTPSSPKPAAETAIEDLVHNLDAAFHIPLTAEPAQAIAIRLRTENTLQTFFRMNVEAPEGIAGGLKEVAKPLMNTPDVEQVKAWMLWAAGVALAVSVVQKEGGGVKSVVGLDTPPPTQMDVDGEQKVGQWTLAAMPGVVRRKVGIESRQVKEISFVFRETKPKDDGEVELLVRLKRRMANGSGKETKDLIYKSEAGKGKFVAYLPYVLNTRCNWNGHGQEGDGLEKWEKGWVEVKE